MSVATKKIIFVGTMAQSTGETLTFPIGQGYEQSYHRMDVIFNVNSIAGTSPSMSYSIQEAVSNNSGVQVFMETGNSGQITASGIGKFVLHEASLHAGDVGSQGMMGKLMQKQIVSTRQGTSVTAVSTDVYAVFYNEG